MLILKRIKILDKDITRKFACDIFLKKYLYRKNFLKNKSHIFIDNYIKNVIIKEIF